MSVPERKTAFDVLQLDGESCIPDTTAVTGLEVNSSGLIRRAEGATVPADDDNNYAVGAFFIDTDGGVGATLYINEGTTTNCDFNAINAFASAPTNVTCVDTADDNATFYPLLADGATGSQAVETDGEFTFNPSTGLLTATSFSGIIVAAAEAADETCSVLFATATTGSALKTNTGLTFNAATSVLTATGFAGPLTGAVTGNVTGNCSGSSGSCTGNSATATSAATLTTPRSIGGVDFNGSASIVPTTIVVADTTDTTCWLGLFEEATGNLLPKTDEDLTWNASTKLLSLGAGDTGKITFWDANVFVSCNADGEMTLSADTKVNITSSGSGVDDVNISGTMSINDNITVGSGSDKKVIFRDTALYINSSVDGQLDIDADNELEIATKVVDMNLTGEAADAFQVVVSTAGTATNAGGAITITAGTGNTTGAGGAVAISAGVGGNNAVGGAASLTAGNAGGGARAGGNSSLVAGAGSTTGAGGNAYVTAGAGGADAVGGDLVTTAGAAGGGNRQGGTASITGGVGAGSAAGGTMLAYAGNAAAGTSGNGGAAYVAAGNAGIDAGTGAGGTAYIYGGDGGATSGNAGGVTIAGGTPVVGNGGSISITGSNAIDAGAGARAGGAITLTAGNAIGTGDGGDITVTAGNCGEGVGTAGDVILTGGAIGGGAVAGRVKISSDVEVADAKMIQFRADTESILSSGAGQLDIDALTEVEITTKIVDINLSGDDGDVFQVTCTTSGDGIGGAMTLTAGAGFTNFAGGAVAITAGAGAGNGAGGAAEFKAGAGAGNQAGGEAKLTAGAGGATGTGGAITITAGAATTGTGGGVTIVAGATSTLGNGGQVTITGGASSISGNGGAVVIAAGTPIEGDGGLVSLTASAGVGTDQPGGNASLVAGASTGTAAAGDVVITAGAAAGAGAGGDITLTAGTTVGGTAGVVSIAVGNVTLNNSKLVLRGTGAAGTEYLQSDDANDVILNAAAEIDVVAPTINLTASGTVTVSNDLAVIGRLVTSTVTTVDLNAGANDINASLGNVFDVDNSGGACSLGAGGATDSLITNGTAGQVIYLIFGTLANAITVTDGDNLKSAGNMIATGDDTITLIYDGSNWVELARSVN